MKNLKYQLLILLLLLAMVVTVFGGMFIWITDIDLIFKIVFTVACILLSIYIFIGLNKMNKKLIYIEKVEKPEKIRCPKCYNEYDGVECLVCGYKKN